jgi:alkanesulfonate monooxygenase
MQVYSVTPPSTGQEAAADEYRAQLAQVAIASENARWSGILVPHSLHDLDPWIVAGHIGAITTSLAPLLALQPACAPPHQAAACAAAYATLYGRPLHFNLVAGAREDEMRSIGDDLSHDERYDRLREYGRILRMLLGGQQVTAESPHYSYRKFTLNPCPAVLARTRIFIAGSSPASMSVAAQIADVIVTHPAPYPDWRRDFLEPLRATGYPGSLGIRMGIIARPTRAEAWDLATKRFPETWLGRQETLLKTLSPNSWSRDLARRAVAADGEHGGHADPADPYWLGAFRTGGASAPFLVGEYGDVAARLTDYVREGVGHLLLNGCENDDFAHVRAVAEMAARTGATKANDAGDASAD